MDKIHSFLFVYRKISLGKGFFLVRLPHIYSDLADKECFFFLLYFLLFLKSLAISLVFSWIIQWITSNTIVSIHLLLIGTWSHILQRFHRYMFASYECNRKINLQNIPKIPTTNFEHLFIQYPFNLLVRTPFPSPKNCMGRSKKKKRRRMLASILIKPTNINFDSFSLIYVYDSLFLYPPYHCVIFCKLNLFIYSTIFCVSLKLFFFGTDVLWILLNIVLFLPISLSLLW